MDADATLRLPAHRRRRHGARRRCSIATRGSTAPAGCSRVRPPGAAAPPRLPPAVERDVRLAAGRRRVPGRDGLAGLRAVQRAGRAVAGRDRDDGADDRVPAARRRASSDRFDRRRLHGRRRPRCAASRSALMARALADRGARALARRRARRRVRRGRARSSARPSTRSCPRSCRPTSSPQANALDQLVRPIALRLVGPGARRRAHRASSGAGAAFALDAASFLVSAAARARDGARAPQARGRARGSVIARHARGLALRPQPRRGCGRRSPRAAIAYLLFMGPAEVLLPYVVKNDLGGSRGRPRASSSPPAASARSAARSLMGQRGLPRRDITFMYVTWTLATLAVAGYGLASAVWQLMLASLAFNALETAGTIVWATAKQRHVPDRAARPRLEPGLADLDRPAAAVLRADRPGRAARSARGRR